MGYLLTPIILLTFLALIFGTFFIVKQQSAAIVERFGKFLSVRQSGLQIKIPLVDNVSGRLSLRIKQLDVVVETKTKDDVFVKIKLSSVKSNLFDSKLVVGNVVMHERFGKGRVISIEGIGGDRKAEIKFEKNGIKKLLLRFSKLEIIS